MRRLSLIRSALGGGAMLACSAAMAQAPDSCTQSKWPLKREQQAFTGVQLPIIKSGAAYPGMMQGVTVALDPQGQVAYPVPPTHKPKASQPHGAALQSPPITVPGTYQITVSEPAWIDVVQDGKLVREVGFTESKDCKGVQKSVRFALKGGPVTIEISDVAQERVNLDILPIEAE